MIVSSSGKNIDNFNNLLTDPIIGDESNIANPIIFNSLVSKVFLPCTLEMCNSCSTKIITAEQHNILKSNLENKKLTESTSVTAAGVEEIADGQILEKLKDMINQNASKSASKTARNITRKYI